MSPDHELFCTMIEPTEKPPALRATMLQTRPVSQSGDPRQAKRLQQVARNAPSRLRLFERVYAGKASPRECIKAFCLECLGFDEALIRTCTATACPLRRIRPYQRKEGGV